MRRHYCVGGMNAWGIPTAEFIPLVENTSLIKPLTEFVIAQSIEQLLLIREAGLCSRFRSM